MEDDRWTYKSTMWDPRAGRRLRGRHRQRTRRSTVVQDSKRKGRAENSREQPEQLAALVNTQSDHVGPQNRETECRKTEGGETLYEACKKQINVEKTVEENVNR
ncbi:hypothetical protein ANN_09456 [Periplaneta americana]|uniref:Uncharacterized protein n=1 Tax=Periplaneta americana TaxID=6978 RepID=A0ABQ8TLP0_PERAM|nr:hypothetical protein ANN_09456 [Periplaneta americana]